MQKLISDSEHTHKQSRTQIWHPKRFNVLLYILYSCMHGLHGCYSNSMQSCIQFLSLLLLTSSNPHLPSPPYTTPLLLAVSTPKCTSIHNVAGCIRRLEHVRRSQDSCKMWIFNRWRFSHIRIWLHKRLGCRLFFWFSLLLLDITRI